MLIGSATTVHGICFDQSDTMIWTQWFGQTAHHLSVFTSIQERTGQREGSHLGTTAHRIYQMIECTYTSSAPQETASTMCGPYLLIVYISED